MKYAVDIVLALVVLWTLLSWASAPSQVFDERTQRQASEGRVTAQATEIALLQARLRPTACPYFNAYSPTGRGC